MQVTIGLNFSDLMEEISNEMCNRLKGLGYTDEQIGALEKSFNDDFDCGYMDATFEIELNDEENEVTSCTLVGG